MVKSNIVGKNIAMLNKARKLFETEVKNVNALV